MGSVGARYVLRRDVVPPSAHSHRVHSSTVMCSLAGRCRRRRWAVTARRLRHPGSRAIRSAGEMLSRLVHGRAHSFSRTANLGRLLATMRASHVARHRGRLRRRPRATMSPVHARLGSTIGMLRLKVVMLSGNDTPKGIERPVTVPAPMTAASTSHRGTRPMEAVGPGSRGIGSAMVGSRARACCDVSSRASSGPIS